MVETELQTEPIVVTLRLDKLGKEEMKPGELDEIALIGEDELAINQLEEFAGELVATVSDPAFVVVDSIEAVE